jgi:MFS transporter, MHS family, alpha-ketoglutarate permease
MNVRIDREPEAHSVATGHAVPPSEQAHSGSLETARRKSILVGAVGNFVDFYDWTIYAFMAPVFAREFFPSNHPTISLLLAFSAFALGYVVRPLGSILFGIYSDRAGRRTAMTVAILTMGLCCLIIGLCPNYASIGVLAPVILVLVRLFQGLSAGGEAGSATTYLVEFGRPGRRALAGSWQQISTGLSTLAALGTSALLTAHLDPLQMASWGWRIPFFIGAILALTGLYLRLRADETPIFKSDIAHSTTRKPVLISLVGAWRSILLVSAIALLPSIAYLTWQIFLPTYIAVTTGIPRATALNISIIGVIVFLVLIAPAATLSDIVGRRPMMIGFAVATLLWSYPTYVGIPHFFNSYSGLVFVTVVGNIILAAMAGSVVACMTEQFETSIRASGNGLSFAIGVVVSGAIYPPLVTALMGSKQYSWIAVFVMVTAIISLTAYLIMPETRDRSLSVRVGS